MIWSITFCDNPHQNSIVRTTRPYLVVLHSNICFRQYIRTPRHFSAARSSDGWSCSNDSILSNDDFQRVSQLQIMGNILADDRRVFQPPQALPGFWIFMYRVSPLTYIVDGIAATGLHGKKIKCSGSEIKIFNPPSETTCGNYLEKYLTQAPGQLLNPLATDGCQYCPLSNADQMLSLSGISWGARWENFGIGWSYIVFNIFMAMGLYYAFRVRKWKLLSQWKPGSIIWYWMRVIGFICSALVVGVIVQYQ